MSESNSWLDRLLLRAMRRVVGPGPLTFAVGSRMEDASSYASLVPVIRFADRRALAAVLLNREIGFGEGYAAGRITVEGPLVSALEAVYQHPPEIQTPLASLASRWLTWIQSNDPGRSRRNIHQHYDLPTDFYRLWLDPQLVYTCAYFPAENTPLAEAQTAKLDLVCRKLRLRPGETVVEAGCGWGAFALHMARHYGVQVKAFNISREQIAFARDAARQQGLTDRVEFVEDDYRNIKGRFDVFVSLGMLEHVGREHFGTLGRAIHGAIGDSGRALLHFIGRNRPASLNSWIRKRIFPGAYPPALREALALLEPHDFSVLDVENLRLHYARTLEHWLARFEECRTVVEQRFGADFARAWQLYLAGSIAAFHVGSMQLFQVLFAGRACQGMPVTRAHLYQDALAGQERDAA